jgi:uncharacterized membrane protein YgcG
MHGSARRSMFSVTRHPLLHGQQLCARAVLHAAAQVLCMLTGATLSKCLLQAALPRALLTLSPPLSSQVVNGLMNAAPHSNNNNNFVLASGGGGGGGSSGSGSGRHPHKALPALAVVPLGTASDFCKSCGW